MSGNACCDVSIRLRVVELYEQGHGRDAIASLSGRSSGAVRERLAVYRPAGALEFECVACWRARSLMRGLLAR